MSLQDLASQQQPPDPNAPGGPAPDPRTLAPPPTPPPPSVDRLIPRPVKTSREPPPSGQEAGDGDGTGGGDTADLGDQTASADTGVSPGRFGDAPPAMYMPHSANRSPNEWRQPSWQVRSQQSYPGVMGGVYAPAPYEAYPLIAATGSQLASMESPDVAEPARQAGQLAQRFSPILDMISGGKFSKNFNAASLGRMKLEMAQMQLQVEKAYMAHQQKMIDYGSILEEARVGGITPEQAKYRLEHHIYLNDDQFLNEILQNKGLGAAEKFLQVRDAKMNDMLAGHTAIKKATGGDTSNAALAAYGETGTAADGGIAYPELPNNDGTLPQTAQAGTPQATAPVTPDADYTKNIQSKHKLNDTEMQDVQSMLDGETPNRYADLKKGADKNPNAAAAQSKMDSAYDDMNADMRRVASAPDDPKLGAGGNIDAKLAKIANISPARASKLRGLLNYETDPKDESTLKDQRSNLIAQAKLIDPKYDEGNYANVHRFSNPGTVENRTLTRTGNITQNYLRLQSSLNQVGENEKIPTRVLKAWMADNYSGDPKWDAIYGNIRNLAINLNGLQTMTGTPRVTLVHDIVAKLGPTASPRTIRTQLQNDMIDAYRVVNDYQEQYQNLTGRDDRLVPGISRTDYQAMRAITRQNPDTGEMPKGRDVPYEVTAVSRDPSQAARGLTEAQKQSPLNMTQVTTLDQFIKDHAEDPDPDIQQQVQEARVRLGGVLGLGERIPALDNPPNAPRR
ncbi:MAG TPA: hypothetical protein VHT52_12360 [Stellaceae bacterium]|jgi:hypothetical protein|nr:hypothetical protein [Stellaceae bacterium]